jgi:type IV secretory pathway TraG/TraD family ATPase VirD4
MKKHIKIVIRRNLDRTAKLISDYIGKEKLSQREFSEAMYYLQDRAQYTFDNCADGRQLACKRAKNNKNSIYILE